MMDGFLAAKCGGGLVDLLRGCFFVALVDLRWDVGEEEESLWATGLPSRQFLRKYMS